MTRRLVLLGEALVTAAAATVAVAAVIGGWHGAALYVALAVVVVLGGAPTRLAVRSGDSHEPAPPSEPGGIDDRLPLTGPLAFTTVVRAGGEPREVLESTVALAAHLGPIVVVGRDDRALDVHGLGVPSYTAPTTEEALRLAARDIVTAATLVVSGRAVPVADACARAARLLTGDVGWVDGAVGTLNDDSYVDDRAARLTERLRARAHGEGVDLWEPDATMVRTELLDDRPIPLGRPWGRWLRGHRADGLRGVLVDDALSLRLAPSSEVAFWPDTTARQRAAAADAADAAETTRGRARRGALALVAHELVAWRAVAVAALLLPMFADRYAGWVVAPSTTAGVVGAVAAWRWLATRLGLGLPLRPAADLVATLYRMPGSLVAAGPAITGRLRPMRLSLPPRPLSWAATLFTAVSGADLVSRTAAGTSTVRSITLTLLLLGLVWAFAVRAFLRRNWGRTTFRVPVELGVDVDGVAARSLDASPRGLSVAIDGALAVGAGDRVVVEVTGADGVPLSMAGRLAGVRTRGTSTVLGIGLELDPRTRGPWLHLVVDNAVRTAQRRRHPRRDSVELAAPAARAGVVTRWSDRLAAAVGVALSAAVLACLVLVLSGYHTLVIRSGSMEPALGVGDVVVGAPVAASTLRPGDVVTVDRGAEDDDSLTHRIESVREDGDDLVFTTRGDANRRAETWTVPRDRKLVSARWTIPVVGRPALALRDGTLGEVFVAAGVMIVVVTVARGAAGGRPPTAAPTSA